MEKGTLIEANRQYDEALHHYMRVDTSEENARALKRASENLNKTIDARKAGKMTEAEEKTETKIAKTMTNGELYRFAWVAVREAIENAQKWQSVDSAEIVRLQAQEKELKELMKISFTKTE